MLFEHRSAGALRARPSGVLLFAAAQALGMQVLLGLHFDGADRAFGLDKEVELALRMQGRKSAGIHTNQDELG